LEKALKNSEKRFKELEQSKKEADDENQLLLSFLLNEIGSKDIENLKKLLAGQKLIEILTELDVRKQDIQSEVKIKEQEKSQCKITELEETIGEQENKVKSMNETIN
ncbi:8069_t:CDS:2, partial [Funneliformis mosseae]